MSYALAMDITIPTISINREATLAKLNRKAIKHINTLKLDNASWATITVKEPLRYEMY